MTQTKSNKMKALAAGAAITCVLGGGAVAFGLPSFASASIASHGADDAIVHVSQGADDPAGHDAADDKAVTRSQVSDDPAGHDAADDTSGSDSQVSDEPAGHDAADDKAVADSQVSDDPAGHGEFRRSSQRWAFRGQTVDVAWLLRV
jgi:hypothetical protein